MECEVSNKSSIKVMLPGQIMTERSIDEVIEDIDKRNNCNQQKKTNKII